MIRNQEFCPYNCSWMFYESSSLTRDVAQHPCWYSSPGYALRIQPGRFCFPDILFGYKSMPAGGFRDDSTSGTACLSTVNSHHWCPAESLPLCWCTPGEVNARHLPQMIQPAGDSWSNTGALSGRRARARRPDNALAAGGLLSLGGSRTAITRRAKPVATSFSCQTKETPAQSSLRNRAPGQASRNVRVNTGLAGSHWSWNSVNPKAGYYTSCLPEVIREKFTANRRTLCSLQLQILRTQFSDNKLSSMNIDSCFNFSLTTIRFDTLWIGEWINKKDLIVRSLVNTRAAMLCKKLFCRDNL